MLEILNFTHTYIKHSSHFRLPAPCILHFILCRIFKWFLFGLSTTTGVQQRLLHYFHLSACVSGLRCAIARVSTVIEAGLIPDQQGRMKSLQETQHDIHYCCHQRGNPQCSNVSSDFQPVDIRVIKSINYEHKGIAKIICIRNAIVPYFIDPCRKILCVPRNSCSSLQQGGLAQGKLCPRSPSIRKISLTISESEPRKIHLELVALSDSCWAHVTVDWSLQTVNQSTCWSAGNVTATSHWFSVTSKFTSGST